MNSNNFETFIEVDYIEGKLKILFLCGFDDRQMFCYDLSPLCFISAAV